MLLEGPHKTRTAHGSYRRRDFSLPSASAITSPSVVKEPVVTADPITLSLRFAATGVTVSRLTLIVKRANDIFCEHATKNS